MSTPFSYEYAHRMCRDNVGKDRGISDTQALYAMYPELVVNDTRIGILL